jgi:hypothetical protein
MKINGPIAYFDRVLCLFIGALNRCTRCLLPLDKRCWGEALIAEQEHIETGKGRLVWAAGGVFMTAKELLQKAADDRWTWLTAFMLGTVSAIIDLHSATRWPHIFLLFSSALILACWRPEWAWRWALAAGLCLPALVLLTRYWGPYALDQFDVFYGLVPATAGVICGVCLRRIFDRLHRNAITR